MEVLEEMADMGAINTVDNRLRRFDLKCSFCPPHRFENATYYKRSPKKPKYKDHR